MNPQRSNLRKYIIPSMVSNAAFFVLTIADGMFVGNGVGTDALGAVSLAMPYVMLIGAVSVLFTIGGVAVTAIRLGRGDQPGANQAFMHAFAAVTAVFAAVTVAGTTLSGQIATILGANDTYHQMVSDYIFWYSIFAVPAGLFTCLANFCRNDGDPKRSTAAALVCTAAVNIVVQALPKYCLNFVFAATSAVLASYLFSTKRTQYAIPLNICRSIVLNFCCINFLPVRFGAQFVWYAVAVAEAICLGIAVVLWRVSERRGIVYH